MNTFQIVPEDSPLRRPPSELSRRQVLFLDGIRYAAEMADLAYERLSDGLQGIARSEAKPSTRDIAAVMLDAWSVIDAVHRFVDLASSLPGLSQDTWLRLLRQRSSDALKLRDDVQHQIERVATLTADGNQIWGYISWAATDQKGKHTGKWLMISPGADYVGDKWIFIGPNKLPFPVPPGHIRLNAFNRRVYLGMCVEAVIEAVNYISDELANGRVRPLGSAASDRRGADMVMKGAIEVLSSNAPPPSDSEGTK